MSAAALIKLLADGNCHSGEALGRQLGVSRAAIWKQLRQLEEWNIVVESVKGSGYRLPEPIILLDAEQIAAQLLPAAQRLLAGLHIFPCLDSTNTDLLARARDGAPAGTLVLAEQQRAGRGRRGRDWQSPFGRNLYVSLLLRVDGGVAALEGLSLAVGVLLVEALQAFGVAGLELKWPNDVLFNGKKLGGILVEMSGDLSGACAAVIGFGLNVNMPGRLGAGIDQPWIDLAAIVGADVDRNQLLAALLNHLLPELAYFVSAGFAPFASRWQQYDALFGKEVAVALGDELLPGVARGITATGGLRLETLSGEKIITGGEVSVRARL